MECNDSIYASIASPKCTKCRRVLVFDGPQELLCVEGKLPKNTQEPFSALGGMARRENQDESSNPCPLRHWHWKLSIIFVLCSVKQQWTSISLNISHTQASHILAWTSWRAQCYSWDLIWWDGHHRTWIQAASSCQSLGKWTRAVLLSSC